MKRTGFMKKIDKKKSILRKGRIKRICNQCGCYFLAWRNDVKKGGAKFCSVKCMAISHKSNPSITIGRQGSKNPMWKGGRSKHSEYIRINLGKHTGGRVFEHRIVMEKVLKRKLLSHERIHHINGIKTDNRPENLMIVTLKTHYGKVGCPYCQKEFLIK